MLAIKTDKDNWTNETLIGQIENDVILEVEQLPTDIDYEEITETSCRFWQRSYDGVYGEKMTYSEFLVIRNLIESDGEATSIVELLINKLNSQEEQIIEIQDALLEEFGISLGGE